MGEICARCALPKPLCVCETIAKESQRIKVYVEKKKFGKMSTIIEGLDEREIDLKEVAKELKSSLACGGTAKEGKIELQGDHRQKVRTSLTQMGFAKDSIELR
jgi:translation initiation factor 1